MILPLFNISSIMSNQFPQLQNLKQSKHACNGWMNIPYLSRTNFPSLYFWLFSCAASCMQGMEMQCSVLLAKCMEWNGRGVCVRNDKRGDRDSRRVYIFPADYLPTAATKYICNRMHPREHHPLFQRSNHVIHPELQTRLKYLSGSSCSRRNWTQTCHVSVTQRTLCLHVCLR